jgi:signal peptidase I
MTQPKPIWREYLEALLIAVIFATFVRTFMVQAFKIPSGSMEQNLLVGDHILVNKFIFGPTALPLERWLLPARPVHRGDVVVFKYPQDPGRDFIKRCIGLPGDVIQLLDKQLLVNGQEVDESGYAFFEDDRVFRSRFAGERYRLRDNYGPYTVPAESYFCLGDNRDNSRDSRYWGPVPESYVKGRALLVYWSFASEQQRPRPPDQVPEKPGWGGRVLAAGRAVWDFFADTRWRRSFRLVR